MRQLIRTTAAATACAVALSVAPAGAETITRDTTQRVTVEKTCEWEVDAKGNPVNLKQELRETQLLLFYFGSQWNAQFNKGCSAVRVPCTYPACDGREPHLPS